MVTGASRGLGKELVYELAKRKFNVLLVSLPGDDLAGLCNYISHTYAVDAQYSEEDLTEISGLENVVKWVKENYKLQILINNAGFGMSGKFTDIAMSELDKMILINVRAAALLTHQLLPLLKATGHANILNVSSMASFSPMGFKSAYPASKVFIESFSRGLNEELRGSGVTVSSVHPGPMGTNAHVQQRITNQSFFGKLGALKPDIVAKVAVKKMLKGKSKIVVGVGNRIHWALMRMLPSSLVIRITTIGVRKEMLKWAK